MKRIMVGTALLALLMAGPAMGQMQTVQKQIYFGIKGGVNLANLSIDPEPDPSPDMLMGIAGGATLAFVISPGMTLDTDFLYMQKGAKWDWEIEDQTGEVKWKYTYLVINPMFRFTVQNEGMRPFFMAGPEIGFLLDAEAEAESDEGETATEDLKDYTKSTDFGINFGAGLEFPSGNSTIFVEARYALGLTSIDDEPDDDEEDFKTDGEDEVEIKHRGIYLMAGIRF